MQSLRQLYRIGYGPSSSHTMGPAFAAQSFAAAHPRADRFSVVLYGSLAHTGSGHRTDHALRESFAPRQVDITRCAGQNLTHPNTLDLIAWRGQEKLGERRAMSIGGGEVRWADAPQAQAPSVYPEHSFSQIAEYCRQNRLRLSDYVFRREGDELRTYLDEVWQAMAAAVQRGIAAEGELPGGLHVVRRAANLYRHGSALHEDALRRTQLVSAYAFAVGEENSAGGIVATAPTCGACGVLPAVLYYRALRDDLPPAALQEALAVAGIVGNLVKHNASISGAQCGCQAEIGTACSMAAAAWAHLDGQEIHQVEYAAEMAMEHHLGLTCDPVAGLVQIPCIERGAVAALRAIDAAGLAALLAQSSKISFDLVVQTMYETGKDLHHGYRETALAGLAKVYGAQLQL